MLASLLLGGSGGCSSAVEPVSLDLEIAGSNPDGCHVLFSQYGVFKPCPRLTSPTDFL